MSENYSGTDETSMASARENFEASKSHALQAAEELRAAASAKAQQLKDAAEGHAQQLKGAAEEKAHHLRGVAEEKAVLVRDAANTGLDDARQRAEGLIEETEEYVRENPTKAVLTALGVGFVLGLIIRR